MEFAETNIQLVGGLQSMVCDIDIPFKFCYFSYASLSAISGISFLLVVLIAGIVGRGMFANVVC